MRLGSYCARCLQCSWLLRHVTVWWREMSWMATRRGRIFVAQRHCVERKLFYSVSCIVMDFVVLFSEEQRSELCDSTETIMNATRAYKKECATMSDHSVKTHAKPLMSVVSPRRCVHGPEITRKASGRSKSHWYDRFSCRSGTATIVLSVKSFISRADVVFHAVRQSPDVTILCDGCFDHSSASPRHGGNRQGTM